jgi:uncharacterized protein
MTSLLLCTLLVVQMAMGTFDMVYHHELTERLAWRPRQKRELALHAARNFLYALLFAVLGLLETHGLYAALVAAVLAVEVVITLADFVEEDLSRKLPATERVAHALLALNYGAILVLIAPVLWAWAQADTAIVVADHGLWSLFMGLAAFAVSLFGVRDLAASLRSSHLAARPAGPLVASLPPRQTILVTGATGFIGRRLVEALSAAGHTSIVLTRDATKTSDLAPPFQVVTDLDQIAGDTRIDAVVNLAGEPVAGGLWTAARRKAIVGSRVRTTDAVIALIERLDTRPRVLVGASAIGWYGLSADEVLTEGSPPNACFSHDVCAAAEAETLRAEACGVRVVLLRIGLVLGIEGGMLSRLLTPFEFGLGGPIGSGRQWMSWIARDDLIRLIAHAVAQPTLSGPVNATAPQPVTNRAFSKALGRALHRPALLRVPAMPLRLVGGDFARELLLGGQRVVPAKALASGFAFRHETIDDALAAILGVPAKKHKPAPLATSRLKLY